MARRGRDWIKECVVSDPWPGRDGILGYWRVAVVRNLKP